MQHDLKRQSQMYLLQASPRASRRLNYIRDLKSRCSHSGREKLVPLPFNFWEPPDDSIGQRLTFRSLARSGEATWACEALVMEPKRIRNACARCRRQKLKVRTAQDQRSRASALTSFCRGSKCDKHRPCPLCVRANVECKDTTGGTRCVVTLSMFTRQR